MALVYDGTRSAKQGGGWIERADPYAYGSTELPALRAQAAADLDRSQRRWRTADKFAYAAAAVPFGAAAAPYLMGGGTAALPEAATEGVGFSSAGTSGAGMNLGRLLGSRGFDTVANGLTSLFGMRAQNKANKYATDANSRLTAQQIAMENDRLARTDAADTADRADAERRWLAEQAQAKEAFDYNRAINDRSLRLDDEREARRSAYRTNFSDPAMRSLGSILRLR